MLDLNRLNPEQLEAATTINGPMLVIAGAGTGKALLNGTGVLTHNGYVAIETLKVGDKVYGRDGQLHNVFGVYPQGKKEIIEVTFSDGAIIKCCEDHLWTYHTASRRDKNGKWQTAPLKEIEKMDLKRRRGKWNRNNIYIPMCDPIQFHRSDVPISPYLMGALIGDGGLTGRQIRFANDDNEILDRVNAELALLKYKLKHDDRCDYFVIRNGDVDKPLITILKELHLYKCHSNEKFIPDIYKYNDIRTRRQLLAGLIDTDGCVSDGGASYEYCTVSMQLAKDIQFLCESLGMTAKISTKIPSYTYNGERRQGKTAYRLKIKTSKNNPNLNYTSRKTLNEDGRQSCARRHIVSIKHTGEYGDMTCIAVDSDDSLFITEHCIVTHNTKTLISRTAYMISEGINPEQILMLTFTNKAAKEMKDRLVTLIDGDYGNKVLACTFHSFCALMLRKYGNAIGIVPHFTILSPGDDEDIISIVKSYADKTRYKGRGFPPSGKVCDFISMSVNKDMALSDVLRTTKYSHFVDEVIELAKLSSEYRKEHNMLNYDDILLRFIDLLNMKPEIAAKIANTYQYIMVDEYQDTNPLQEAILLELFRYTKNIAVVGDDMQSLYGFRGAEVENIINFPNKFPGCKTVTLVRNYRSNQEILDLGNKVCQCATEGFPKELIGTHHSHTLPTVVSVNNQYEETEYVVDLIRRIHAQGVPYNEICIVERNSMLSAGIEIKLNKMGVDFDKYGGAKYTDLSYVKDILAYLKVMTNPYDEISWFRILQVHKGIGMVNARKISEKCRTSGFSALIDKSYAKRQYGPELKNLNEQLNSCEGLKLTEMISSFIKFYCDTNKKNIEEMDTDEGARTAYLAENEKHREELYRLVEISLTYRSIDSFLDDLLLDNTKATQNQSDNKLVISTIHSVKGLEFDTVIMLDCIDGIFPKTDEDGSKEDNEELRCFYVAVTRAKERLYLICPRSAMRFGQSIEGIPSRYLKEAEGIVNSNDHQFFDRFKRERLGYDDDWSGMLKRFRNNPYR